MGLPRGSWVAIGAVLALAHWGFAAAAEDSSEIAALDLHKNLPKDPLLVLAVTVEHPEQELQSMLDLLGELGASEHGQSLRGALDRLNRSLGFSTQKELLPLLGPQITLAIDLPPIDYALLALQSGTPEAFTAVLGRIGVVAEVRDSERLDAGLRSVLELAPGEVVEKDGVVGARIPVWINESGAPEEQALDSYVTLQYLIHDGRIAMGFSAEWVRKALEAEPAQDRLAAGHDFALVFAQLDDRPTRLSYVNLPKIRTLVVESHILTTVLGGNPQTEELLRLVSAPEVMEVGLGSTSVAMNGGVRTINFGPRWLSGAVVSSSLVAAMAVPAMIMSADGGKSRQTTEHIEVIARACEGFSVDTQTYPPAEGWVPVDRIALYLEPIYGRALPRLDGWENPILYWSDGSSYRILSTGEDGRMDLDWSGVDTPGVPADSGADIAFGDGRFLAAPAPAP